MRKLAKPSGRLGGLLLALLVLGGCGIAEMVHPLNYGTGKEVEQRIAERTFLFRGMGHGNQIEYYRADGTAFLWYPGNKIVLKGHWMVDEYNGPKIGNNRICFLYGPNTYNPITKTPGTEWECVSAGALVVDAKDEAEGDYLGLADRQRVPFVLPKYVESLAAVKAEIK